MLTSKSTWVPLPVIFIITFFTACTPDTPVVTVNPFDQYWLDNSSNLQFIPAKSDFPFELGYSFVSSIPGYILGLGLGVPDSGTTYTVTIWDGATQAVLARSNLETTQMQGQVVFLYHNLTIDNAEFAIQANHPYMISINLNPVNTPYPGKAPSYDYFNVVRADQANIFPMTEGPITYQHEYTIPAYTPTFPTNLSIYQNYINGVVDIDFSTEDTK